MKFFVVPEASVEYVAGDGGTYRAIVEPGTVSAVVTAMGASQPGHTTYQVSVAFDTQYVADVYALYGDAVNRLSIPPAFQVPTPFGTSVGPQNPAFFAVQPDCEFDSFLTIVSTHAATICHHVCRLTRTGLLSTGH